MFFKQSQMTILSLSLVDVLGAVFLIFSLYGVHQRARFFIQSAPGLPCKTASILRGLLHGSDPGGLLCFHYGAAVLYTPLGWMQKQAVSHVLGLRNIGFTARQWWTVNKLNLLKLIEELMRTTWSIMSCFNHVHNHAVASGQVMIRKPLIIIWGNV